MNGSLRGSALEGSQVYLGRGPAAPLLLCFSCRFFLLSCLSSLLVFRIISQGFNPALSTQGRKVPARFVCCWVVANLFYLPSRFSSSSSSSCWRRRLGPSVSSRSEPVRRASSDLSCLGLCRSCSTCLRSAGSSGLWWRCYRCFQVGKSSL